MANDIADLISKRLAAPKAFRVVTRYESGAEKFHDTETRAQAANWAVGERRKIGRSLVDRTSGATVAVASVEVVAIA